MPSLLFLPPELRAHIFALALTHALPFSIKGIYPAYHGRGATTTLSRNHLALSQANRQLRAETLPLFYARNAFAICLQPVCVIDTKINKKNNKLQKRRSYGDDVSAKWFATLADDAVCAIRLLRVYFACVTRWEGDEEEMERKKCEAYGVADVGGTRAVTVHVLYDGCSAPRLFYEVDLEEGMVESFVEVDGDGDGDGGEEEEWGGIECEVCLAVLRRWVGSVGVVGGKRRVTRGKLAELVWPSGLKLDLERRGDSRI